MERHSQNALAVAKWLEGRERGRLGRVPGPEVEQVVRPRAEVRAPTVRARSSRSSCKGGVDAGRNFIDSLELFSHLANVGDVRSLAIHPASTTHSQLDIAEQQLTGVTPGLVRLSIGIETLDDILADLEAGFRAAKSA